MEARVQPGQKAGFRGGQIDTGHPNLRKSKLPAPGLNLKNPLSSIKTGGHLPPIVETPAPANPGDRAWQGQWHSEADTERFAQRLASNPAILNATIRLQGDLGAGKTTLVRHVLRALGVSGRIKSPTYAVVEPHTSSACALLPAGQTLQIWHFDFYRFTDPREWEDAGFRELFASPGLKLVEWPENAATLMGAADATIELQADGVSETSRTVRFTPLTPAGHQLLAALQA